MIKPQEINEDGLPVLKWDENEEGLPILKPIKKKISLGEVGATSLRFGGKVGGLLNGLGGEEIKNNEPLSFGRKAKESIMSGIFHPDVSIDQNDPAKSVLQSYDKDIEQAKSAIGGTYHFEGQTIKGNKIINPQDIQTAHKTISEFSKEKNDTERNLVPTDKDARQWLFREGKTIDPLNKTDQLAIQTHMKRQAWDVADQQAPTFDDAVASMIGKKKEDIPDATLGARIKEALNDPLVIEKASENADFHNKYMQAKNDLYSNHPAFAFKEVGELIGQKLEDEKMTGWLYANPSMKKVEKAIEMLKEEGKWGDEQQRVFDQRFRPAIVVGVSDKVIPLTDLVHQTGYGIYEGAKQFDASGRDIINKLSGGVIDPNGNGLFQNLGLMETNEARTQRLAQEEAATARVTPTRDFTKVFAPLGHFTGQFTPMIIGSAVGIPEELNMTLMFEGNNADRARELFKGDVGKQNLYTLLGTTFDVFAGKALPTKKAAQGFKNLMERDIKSIITDLSDKKITEEVAQKTLWDKALNYVGKVAGGNTKTAAVLEGYNLAHKGLDAAFGKRDFNVENELNDAISEYPTNWLSSTFLSGLGAVHGNEKPINGKMFKKIADNADYFRSVIDGDAKLSPIEKQDRLEKIDRLQAVGMQLSAKKLDIEQQEKYLNKDMQQFVSEKATKESPDKTLAKEDEKKAAIAEIEKERILDPKISNTEHLEKLFDHLPKGSQEKLSVEGKFNESKVGEYLKYIAQQSNGLKEDWTPHEDGIIPRMKGIPESVIEIANDKWKEKIDAAQTEGEKDALMEQHAKDLAATPPTTNTEEVGDVAKKMQPIAEKMAEVEMEFENKGFEISPDYDGEIIVTNKKSGEIVAPEDIPDNLKKLTADYEKVTRGLSELDERTFAETLNNARKKVRGEETEFEIVPNKQLPQSSTPSPTVREGEQKTQDEIKQTNIESPESIPPEKIPSAETEPIEPPPPTAEGKWGETDGEGTGITHAQTAETRKEFGLPEYEKEADTFAKWDAEAKQRVESGEMPKVIEKLKRDEMPTPVEQRMMGLYIAELAVKAEKEPSNENLDVLHDAVKLSDKIGGSLVGKTLVSRKGTFLPDESLANYFEVEREVNLDAPLTETQKETVKKEHENISDLQKKYDEKVAGLEAENARLKAEAEIKKTPRKKNEKKDYAAERKEIFESIKDKLKKAREETSVTVLPYAKELIAIAPDVAKLVKNLLEDGVTKLGDIVEKIHETLKDEIPAIQKKDIHDIIAGEYTTLKLSKNQIAKQLYELKQEAQLINKYEKLQAGEEPKNEKKKIQRNQELEGLRKQIKEHDLTKLADYKEKTRNKIAELQKELPTATNPPPKAKIKLDKEGQELQTKLINAKRDREIRLLKQEYQNRSKYKIAQDWVIDKLNVPRTIMASMDYSAPLRQGIVAAVAHPRTAGLAQLAAFKASFSPKYFDKWFYEIKETPRYDVAQESGLSLTDPHSPFLTAKEEAFMNNTAEKIPVAGTLIKGSERAYVMFLNKMRWDLFNRFADRMEEKGKTIENSPKEYKKLAEYINNQTGRGGLHSSIEPFAPMLNTMFFAPRLIASRLNLLNPMYYAKLPKDLRVMAAKDMLKFIGLGMTVLALAKLNGAQVDDDPRSSDFGKIKQGNTRWDIWGGFQQYVRVATQLVSGQRKSTNTGNVSELNGKGAFGTNRGDVLLSFMRGKLAPVPSMGADIVSGRTTSGEKPTWGNEAESHLLPLLYSDIKTAVQDRGVKSFFDVGIPAIFGVGTQTYRPRKKSDSTRPPSPERPKIKLPERPKMMTH